MSRTLRYCFSILLALAALPALADYPDQPVRLVVGFPPGGGGDAYGRLIATAMSKTLGESVIVYNRAGAGGNIAAESVAKAKPDGYTLLLAMSGNIAVAAATKAQSLPYKVPDDFASIGLILEAPVGLFVANDSRFKSARQLLAAAKTESLTYGTTGVGGAGHLGMEMVNQAMGIHQVNVSYRGSGPAITDLLGGRIDSFFTTASPLIPLVKQGQLRLLAITGDKRNPEIPDVPTFKELGANVLMTQWYGLMAPADTPEPIVKTLRHHLSMALATPEVREAIRRDAAVEHDLSGDAFLTFVANDIAGYKGALTPELIKQIGN